MTAKFKAPDGYTAHVLVMLSGSRLYMLFVHAKNGTDKLFKALDRVVRAERRRLTRCVSSGGAPPSSR